MQLKDLVKPLDKMTEEELMDRVRQIRHERSELRPAAAAIKERAVRKTTRKKLSATDKLLDKLTPEEREELFKQMGQGESNE